MSWKSPGAGDVAAVVKAAKDRLFICSPFIKHYGIALVEDALPGSLQTIELWTRMDSRAWITGATDPEGVLDFLERQAGKKQVELYTSNLLHAKIILSDSSVAAVGSSNLTRGGWSQNLEIVRMVDPVEVGEVLEFIDLTRPLLSPTSLADFKTFVGECQAHADEKEALLSLVREVAPSPPPGSAPLIPLAEFIRFCLTQNGANAQEVVKIHRNVDLTNRQGHVKQAFYGTQRFFQEFPQYIGQVASASPDEPHEIDKSPVIDDWTVFLQQHKDERDASFDYDIGTLHRILPETLGGIVLGGGGGGYPLKLVFVLVAKRMAS